MTKNRKRQPSAGGQDNDTRILVDLYKRGNYVEMESLARKVLARQPWHSYAQRAVPAALIGQQRYAEAEPALISLLKANPTDWEMWANLGDTHRALGNVDGAIAALGRVLQLNPDYEHAMNALAELHLIIQEPAKALHYRYLALEHSPGNRKYFLDWIAGLISMRLYEQAVEALRAAWEEDRDDPELAVLMIHPARAVCDWDASEAGDRVFARRFAEGHFDNFPPLHLLATPGFGRIEQKIFLQGRLPEVSGKQMYLQQTRSFTESADGRPLRIGYLSGDIHLHATTFLISAVFEKHKENDLELYVYSNGQEDSSKYRQRVVAAATVFRDVRRFSPEQTVRLMVEDQIDILVDLKGWTVDYDTVIMISQPAPITVAWLGYPGTVGHGALADYIIGDPTVTPLDHADGYTETLALMPHCYQPNDNQRPISRTPTRSEAGLPEEAFVFCSFARTDKYTRKMFSIWCELLMKTPGSVLWLWGQNDEAVRNILRMAEDFGGVAERLIFAESRLAEDHLARLSLADLALDSFPYTSHTTGSDALWAGVPLLALEGDTFASRVSSSLLRAAGLPELVTSSYEEFLALGLALAGDKRAWLKELTQRLRSNKMSVPLFDTEGFTRDLARMYRRMWGDFQMGKKEPIVLLPK